MYKGLTKHSRFIIGWWSEVTARGLSGRAAGSDVKRQLEAGGEEKKRLQSVNRLWPLNFSILQYHQSQKDRVSLWTEVTGRSRGCTPRHASMLFDLTVSWGHCPGVFISILIDRVEDVTFTWHISSLHIIWLLIMYTTVQKYGVTWKNVTPYFK